MKIKIEKMSETKETKLFIQPIAKLIKVGFIEKFTNRLFTEEEVDRLALVMSEILCNLEKETILLAKHNDTICGCLYFIKNDTQNEVLDTYLCSKLSFVTKVKGLFLFDFLSHRPRVNESHVDFLTVAPLYQGNGIGQLLLSECRNINYNSKLTLFVAQTNTIAIRLYQKNFKISKKISSKFSKWLTGIDGWYYMEWS